MAIWAIADIHASRTDGVTGKPTKPMDIFGPEWTDHMSRLEEAWAATVGPEDTVLVAGDIDWALHLEEALDTLHRMNDWNGTKALIRGNHDYWWSSKTTNKVRRSLPPTLHLIHNEALHVEGFNICGTKGSPVPGSTEWTADDEKLLNREASRLQMSLDKRDPTLPSIVAIHYPPFFPSSGPSIFSKTMQDTGVACVVYGHLHGTARITGPHGRYGSVLYRLVAGDAVGFRPVLIASNGALLAND